MKQKFSHKKKNQKKVYANNTGFVDLKTRRNFYHA